MREWAANTGSYTSLFNGQKYPRLQLRTIAQLMAGVAMERPSGNVAVDETFKKAPKAKAKNAAHPELELQAAAERAFVTQMCLCRHLFNPRSQSDEAVGMDISRNGEAAPGLQRQVRAVTNRESSSPAFRDRRPFSDMKLPKHLKWPPGYTRLEDFKAVPDDEDDATRLATLEALVWFLKTNRKALESTRMNVQQKLEKTEPFVAEYRAAVERLTAAEDARMQEIADRAERTRAAARKVVEVANQLEAATEEQWAALPEDERTKLRELLPKLLEDRAAALAVLTEDERRELGG